MNVTTKKMNWVEWNEVNEEKAECQEAYEKNRVVDSRDSLDRMLHTEKSDLWF